MKYFIIVLNLLMASLFVAQTAQSQPPIPSSFWGTIKIDDADAPVGTIIIPTINGIAYPSSDTVETAGLYGLLAVNGDDPSTETIDGGNNGDTIVFKAKISGQEITLSPTAIWQSGSTTELNLSGSTAIPVELASFEAMVNGNSVVLKWMTLSESDNYGFEIQRRRKDSDFEKIGFVQGNNTTARPHEYKYIDKNVAPGIYFYRLKQIDIDGDSKLYPARQVEVFNAQNFTLLQNYPNPFNSGTKIIYEIQRESLIKIIILNSLGQQIRLLRHQFEKPGVHQTFWDGNNEQSLPATGGIYFCVLDIDGERTALKMLLLR